MTSTRPGTSSWCIRVAPRSNRRATARDRSAATSSGARRARKACPEPVSDTAMGLLQHGITPSCTVRKVSAEIRIGDAQKRVEPTPTRTYVAPRIPSTPARLTRQAEHPHRRSTMKAKTKIRALRALAIAGSLSALALPSASIARPPTDIPFRAENSQVQQQQQYRLPANFHAEVTSVSQPYTPPTGFHSEVQTAYSPTAASAPASVVHEIRTVTDDGSQTLAIILAAVALAMALGAIAYSWVRLTRVEREVSSRPLVS